jgi:flagellar FliL protein
MSEAAVAPSGEAGAPKKKGLVGKVALPLVLVLVGAGAGAAGAFFAPKFLPAAHKEEKLPKEAPVVAPLDYVEIDNNFTATLQDSGRYVQLRIAISTNGGKPVTDAVARHKLAIIAAVLSVLSTAKEADLNLPGGHDQLARQMRIAINDVLQRKSGLAGVDEVFITSFIVQ